MKNDSITFYVGKIETKGELGFVIKVGYSAPGLKQIYYFPYDLSEYAGCNVAARIETILICLWRSLRRENACTNVKFVYNREYLSVTTVTHVKQKKDKIESLVLAKKAELALPMAENEIRFFHRVISDLSPEINMKHQLFNP